MEKILINRRQYLELEKIAFGSFAPLCGFMDQAEFHSVVEEMRLPNGAVFPLPVVLDVTDDQAKIARSAGRLSLVFEGNSVGEITPTSVYTCDKEAVSAKVFGTRDTRHPGVAHFLRMGRFLIGGPVRLIQRMFFEFSQYEFTPEETRSHFASRGWRTIVGFQTRNVPHRAHEYLLRLALEQADGLFIQPLVGRKKRGDFHPLAILSGYQTLINDFLPTNRVFLGILSTTMRYAGPREALFHAIIRRNYGCTHFIIGRDHAGVGDYYEKYEAQQLAQNFDGELGIQILRLSGPFYCQRCDGIVTERTCPHVVSAPEQIQEISGTEVRAMLSEGGRVASEIMRPEVAASLAGLSLFIDEDEE